MDALQTITLTVVLLFLGYGLRARVGILDRLNLPAPVIGGLVAAMGVLTLRLAGYAPPAFNTVLQPPLMIAFFTSLGFAASFRLLRIGGADVVLLLVISSVVAIIQGALGALIATAFGLEPLVGVLAGTVTLSGGPATGLAFAPQFEAAGIRGAAEIATATAMGGILLASIFGAPLATWIIARKSLDPRAVSPVTEPVCEPLPAHADGHGGAETFAALKAVGAIVIAMCLGSLVSDMIEAAGVTLPRYIGAMIVAAALRNLDDATGWLKLPMRAIELGGVITLSLFLVMAMMTLDLTRLADLALPLVVILGAQLAFMALVMGPTWWLMGRDYDGAVMAGGFAGYMLGTSANAMAIMRALVEKYAHAPRAFLAVPLVGTFMLDFTNALIITGYLNLFGR
jgi:ESS family glutamate:Na+ symporter